MHVSIFGIGLLLWSVAGHAQSPPESASNVRCGEAVTIATHNDSTTRYAFIPPSQSQSGGSVTLVLLAGGSGYVNLNDQGCPQELTGNSLVRAIPIFNAAGFGTALVDAPSNYQGEDGLGGFRIDSKHADDLGKVIADLRVRTQGAVWLVGTSRGTISAVNAASRLSGPWAADGLVLTSALMSGQSGMKKSWVANTVFDLPLENIHLPTLIVGHVEDKCTRSPASLMEEISARLTDIRKQVVKVSGGPGFPGTVSLNACIGHAPHGYEAQESEVAAGIARFIRGGKY